jgi:hypothetical protein
MAVRWRAAAGVIQRSVCSRQTGSQRHFDSAIRMHYNDCVLKKIRDSDWFADHIAAHDVTLDAVREAILEHRIDPSRDARAQR